MRRVRAPALLVVIGLTSACSFEPPADVSVDAAAAQDSSVDADTSCQTDEFDGNALKTHWAMLVGELPTYGVSGSRLLISDSPFAATTSMPATSWIYSLDKDKGNQIGWAQELGDDDFSVEAEIGWATSVQELTLAGIAVTDADGRIAAMVGVDDGTAMAVGQANIKIGVPDAPDLYWYGVRSEIGSATVRIERRDGMAHIIVDGEERLSGSVDALISYVTIYYVRHRNADGMVYPFGSVDIGRITVCR
jgi:hypothetical protein